MALAKIKPEADKSPRAERLLTLARRCEQTRASSQPIDEAIALEFGWTHDEKARTWTSADVRHPVRINAPLFTLVFEHAKQLLPSGFWWSGGTCDESSEVLVQRPNSDDRFKAKIEGIHDVSFVLAFSAACLRAHAAIEEARK